MIGIAHAAVGINTSTGSLDQIIANSLSTIVIPFLGAIAVGAIIYGGVLYMISQGDSDKTSKAKRVLLWAVVGIILIVLSQAIVVALSSVLKNEIIK